jgi:hypothetical protein
MRSGIRALGRYSRQGSFATRAMDKLHMTTWLYFKSRIGEVRRTPRGRVPLDKSWPQEEAPSIPSSSIFLSITSTRSVIPL